MIFNSWKLENSNPQVIENAWNLLCVLQQKDRLVWNNKKILGVSRTKWWQILFLFLGKLLLYDLVQWMDRAGWSIFGEQEICFYEVPPCKKYTCMCGMR